jgi:hypothetical protein
MCFGGVWMKFFKRNLYDVMGLTELSLFREKSNVKKFWKESYEEQFKDKESTYEKAIVSMIPELGEYIATGEKLYTQEGPSEVLQLKIPELVSRFHEKWEKMCNEYNQYYRKIVNSLPTSMVEFKKCSIHDAVILDIQKPKEDELIIELDGSSCCYECYRGGNFKILFEGIKLLDMPKNSISKLCLYEEVHLCHEGKFDYRLLLDEGEMRIIADHVQVI